MNHVSCIAVLTIGFLKMENKNITCTFYEDKKKIVAKLHFG